MPLTPKWMRLEQSRIRNIFTELHPEHEAATGPVMLRFTAVFEVPKSWPAAKRAAALAGKVYYTSTPDYDNIGKMIGDSLNGIAWIDDAQLQGGGVKRYGAPARLIVDLDFLEGESVTPAEDRRVAKFKQGKLFPDPPKRLGRR